MCGRHACYITFIFYICAGINPENRELFFKSENKPEKQGDSF
jgi:hypothetical protein